MSFDEKVGNGHFLQLVIVCIYRFCVCVSLNAESKHALPSGVRRPFQLVCTMLFVYTVIQLVWI